MSKDLASRVYAQRARENGTGNTDGTDTPGQRDAPREGRVFLSQEIERMSGEFGRATDRIDPQHLIRDALSCLRTVRKLDQCDPQSLLGALMTCAQVGLRPIRGLAWILPFWDKRASQDERGRDRGGYRAQFVLGYRGAVDLAYRSGLVRDITVMPRYEKDLFRFRTGTCAPQERILHEPYLDGNPGPVRGYYAAVGMINGGVACDYMGHAEMLEHREQYAPRDQCRRITGPWVTHFRPMALKTVFLRLTPWIPQTPDLYDASVADGGLRTNTALELSPAEATLPVDPDDMSRSPDPRDRVWMDIIAHSPGSWDDEELGREFTRHTGSTSSDASIEQLTAFLTHLTTSRDDPAT